MSNLAHAVQAAVKAALDTAIAPAKIYERVPDKASFPYVVFDGQEGIAADALDEPRDEIYLYLSVWSKYSGSKEVLQLIGKIYDAMHRAQLELTEGRMVRATVTRRRNRREPDGVTFMGNVTLRIIAEH